MHSYDLINDFEQKLFTRYEALSIMRDSSDKLNDVMPIMTQLLECLMMKLKAMEGKGCKGHEEIV